MKKYLVIFICVAMVATFGFVWWSFGAIAQGQTVSQNCTYLAPVFGDANEDLQINVADITKIEREILGYDALTLGADANQDNEINMGDVVCVERQIFGLNPIYGDVDLNFKINDNDIVELKRIILGLAPENENADANFDGKVSIGDITWIQKMLTRSD